MGQTTYSSVDWDHYRSTTASKTRDQIFTNKKLASDFDPRQFKIRESRDSVANPQASPIIVAEDVTGSMGFLAEALLRTQIGVTFEEIIKRAAAHEKNMVTDPHLMVMAIGDCRCDTAPIQATQFESAGDVLAKQLEQVWIEGHGGGNSTESYDGPWYLAATRTSTDQFEKRGKKGYLFTVGDEEAPAGWTREHIKQFFGDDVQHDLSAEQLLAMAEEKWHVYHVIIEEGDYARGHLTAVKASWQKLLHQHSIPLPDHTKLAEVIVSAIQLNEGMSLDAVVGTWTGDTALVVAGAMSGLSKTDDAAKDSVIRF